MKNMLGISLQEALGPINDFLGKLGGSKGKQWFIAFKRFLRKEDPWADGIMFKKNIIAINPREEINDEDVRNWLSVFHTDSGIEKYFDLLNPKKSVVHQLLAMVDTTAINIVLVSVGDLGFEEASLEEIYGKAKVHGFKLCTKDIALFLCKQGNQKELEEGVIVASEPVGPENVLFEVINQKNSVDKTVETGLRTQNGSMFGIWGKATVFAFEVN